MSKADETLPGMLNTLDQARMTRYKRYLDLYAGNQWPYTDPRRRQLTFNYIKAFIDKTTSYLMANMSYSINPPQEDRTEAAAKAEAALRQVYLDNSLDILDLDTEVDCAILGDACYKVTWDTARERVRITAPDPQGLWAWTRGDDPQDITRIVTRYQLQANDLHLLHSFQSEGPQTVIEDWTDDTFTLFIANQAMTHIANPYGLIPFVLFPNLKKPKEIWGVSDIEPMIFPQQELNRAFSQLSRILEVSGNPIAVLENVEESKDIAVEPGALWNLPPDSRAYILDLLQGGGVRLHTDYIGLVYRALHDISETPRAAFGDTNRDLSGTALQIEMHSLIQKVKRKRLIRSAAYRKRNAIVLAMLHRFTGLDIEGLEPEIIFGEMLPEDRDKQSKTQAQLVTAGLRSRRGAMNDLGVLDPEAEFAEWLEETEMIVQAYPNARLDIRPPSAPRDISPEKED